MSIIVPAYNEEATVAASLRRLLKANIGRVSKEVVVVNDGSSDRTADELEKIRDRRLIVVNRRQNRGKGAAIREGLQRITGEVVVIQDADLEYNPEELRLLLQPIRAGKAEVVYGSRFVGSGPHRVLLFWHTVGNTLLTLLSNMLTNLNLTDMETCYKMFTRKVADKLRIEENRFGFEPEFTAKVARMGVPIYEVGISYSGRGYEEGKKINWKDGLWALWCVVKYNLLV